MDNGKKNFKKGFKSLLETDKMDYLCRTFARKNLVELKNSDWTEFIEDIEKERERTTKNLKLGSFENILRFMKAGSGQKII